MEAEVGILEFDFALNFSIGECLVVSDIESEDVIAGWRLFERFGEVSRYGTEIVDAIKIAAAQVDGNGKTPRLVAIGACSSRNE